MDGNETVEYYRSPYDTRLVGMTPKQSAKLFNAQCGGTMSELVDFKREAIKIKQYNEARRLQPYRRPEEELLSQLHRDQLTFSRRLGKFIKEYNGAVHEAWVKLSR